MWVVMAMLVLILVGETSPPPQQFPSSMLDMHQPPEMTWVIIMVLLVLSGDTSRSPQHIFQKNAVEETMVSKVRDVVVVAIGILAFVIVTSFEPSSWFNRQKRHKKNAHIHCFRCGRTKLKNMGKKEQPLLEEVPKNEAVDMQNVKEQEDERMKLWQREKEKLQERGEKLHLKEEELKERELIVQVGEQAIQEKLMQQTCEEKEWTKEKEIVEEQQRKNKEEELRKKDEEEQIKKQDEEQNKKTASEWRRIEEEDQRELTEFVRRRESVYQEHTRRCLEIEQNEKEVRKSEHVVNELENRIAQHEGTERGKRTPFEKRNRSKEREIKHRELETCRQEEEIREREKEVEELERVMYLREEEERRQQLRLLEGKKRKEEDLFRREKEVHQLEQEMNKRENVVRTREHKVWKSEFRNENRKEQEKERRRGEQEKQRRREEEQQRVEQEKQKLLEQEKNRQVEQENETVRNQELEKPFQKSDETKEEAELVQKIDDCKLHRQEKWDETSYEWTETWNDKQQLTQHVVQGFQQKQRPHSDRKLKQQQKQHGVEGPHHIQDLQQIPQKRRPFPPPPPSYKKPSYRLEQEEVIVMPAGEEDAMFESDSLIIRPYKVSRNAKRFARLMQMADSSYFK